MRYAIALAAKRATTLSPEIEASICSQIAAGEYPTYGDTTKLKEEILKVIETCKYYKIQIPH